MRTRLAVGLFVLGLGLVGSPRMALANPDLSEMLRELQAAREPSQRLAVLVPLMRAGGDRAARALGRLVASDPDVRVRARAAQCLGWTQAEAAPEILEHLIRQGGTRQVRQELAGAMRRQDGQARLLKSLDASRTPRTERLLIVRALAAFDEATTRDALLRHAEGSDPDLRPAAIRALVRRADERTERIAYLTKLLATSRDTDTLLTAMDAAQEVIDPLLKAPLLRLATYLEPEIREGAEHLLTCIEILAMEKRFRAARAARDAADAAAGDRYADGRGTGMPGEDGDRFDPPHPPPPPTRARHDTVYVVDVTGSTWGELPHLLRRMRAEAQGRVAEGGSVRVGVIAYGSSRGPKVRRFQVLPLTFDPARVRAFFDGLSSGGVDDRGAAVAHALAEALERMEWRWSARRTVQLFADTDVDDAAHAKRIVKTHRQADGTRTRIAYVLRTRGKVPPIYAELATLGGPAQVEVLR